MRNNKSGNLQVRCTPELIQGLDDLRRVESDLPSRAEMARRLIERALDAQATRSTASKSKATKR